jgi:competence protein ComEC
MFVNVPILKIFVPFLCGIIFSVLYSIHTDSIYLQSNWIYLIGVIIVLTFGNLALLWIQKSQTFLHIATWFFLGAVIGIKDDVRLNPKHFSHFEADIFEASISQINLSNKKQSKFIRCELNMLYAYTGDNKYDVSGKILAFIDTAAFDQLKKEDTIVIQTIPSPISNQGNPGEFDLQLFWRTKGFTHQAFIGEEELTLKNTGSYRDGVLSKMKQRIVNTLELHLKDDVFAVAMGILLGDKSYLNLELKDAFSGAGAMHLLAVSGLHVGIFLVILQWIFKTFGSRLPSWIRFGIIIMILWTYAGVTGFSPSVNRAVTMFSFVALGTLTGRKYDSMNGLLASAMILLFVNPYFIFDIGFQLSYSAMFGIFLFSPLIEKSIYVKQKWIHFLWSGTAVALAAQLTTFPLTLYYFHQFPNYFLITNIGLMLISGLMMAIGLGLITLGNMPVLGSLIALLFIITITTLIAFVEWVSKLPNAITTGFRLGLWEVFLLYMAMAIFLFGLKKGKKALLFTSIISCVFFLSFQSYRAVQDSQSNDLMVLNTNDPTFFIRRGKQGDLLVISNKENIEEKTQFLKRSLDIYYGINTQIHIIERKKGSIQSNLENFELILKPALVHIIIDKQIYTLVYGDYFRNADLLEANWYIAGTWVNKEILASFAAENQIWMLKERGAVRVK